ncbi:unnamed protein product [Parnassius mnemosyne]|uniref:Uncharacterized protein n=1 Tax=Parnassius mnemosyne TaxID=213953 RepID=A0AAV1LR86_9NEOP
MSGVSSKFKRKISKNSWHLETTTIAELASVLDCNYSELFDEFIDFKNDTNVEVLFKEKEQTGNMWSFGVLFPKNISVQRCAQILLTLFGSTYVYKSSFSKMKYIKTVYRNKLTDSHLDDVIRTAYSDKPDIEKVLKKCLQYQKSL